MRARLLLLCGDVIAGGVTARGPKRKMWTGECPPQGIASSDLFCWVFNGLPFAAVARKPIKVVGRV